MAHKFISLVYTMQSTIGPNLGAVKVIFENLEWLHTLHSCCTLCIIYIHSECKPVMYTIEVNATYQHVQDSANTSAED